ncbi:hypothetical protein IEQ34_020616 [Dendrobium chrysotoxum]|uniref:Uncharacterized protein n=1 Tax=Dendrobium chrysotoxum TaxID=161865 RepID=A0AAV7FKN0_DENCH|nr:hypothetical protein IEQ34_020616 [Dendrobium chrysotoxum]
MKDMSKNIDLIIIIRIGRERTTSFHKVALQRIECKAERPLRKEEMKEYDLTSRLISFHYIL